MVFTQAAFPQPGYTIQTSSTNQTHPCSHSPSPLPIASTPSNIRWLSLLVALFGRASLTAPAPNPPKEGDGKMWRCKEGQAQWPHARQVRRPWSRRREVGSWYLSDDELDLNELRRRHAWRRVADDNVCGEGHDKGEQSYEGGREGCDGDEREGYEGVVESVFFSLVPTNNVKIRKWWGVLPKKRCAPVSCLVVLYRFSRRAERWERYQRGLASPHRLIASSILIDQS